VARPSGYFSSDLVIDPTVSHRAVEAVRRAHERHALVEYGKTWERGEREFDWHSRNQRWLGVVLVSAVWAFTFVTPTIFYANGYATAGSAFGTFLLAGLILFVLFTVASGPASWKGAIFMFGGMIVWPPTFIVLIISLQRRWPERYAERYHRRYVTPATDFDEAATALWARAVEAATGTVLAGPAGWDGRKAVAPRMWAIAELLARSSLPSELDRRSALLDDAARQVDLLGQ
jgi:hypothetical protein